MLWVLVGLVASLFGRRPTLAVVLSWVELHHWLARHVLGIRIAVDGAIPHGPVPDRGQAPVDVRDARDGADRDTLPIIVMKKELRRHSALRLADPALWRHSGRAVGGREGASGAGRGGRARRSRAAGRSSSIPKERVCGSAKRPALQSGFAGAVPRARPAGRSGRGRQRTPCGAAASSIAAERSRSRSARRSPPGFKRDEIEARVHAAINALELGAEARA